MPLKEIKLEIPLALDGGQFTFRGKKFFSKNFPEIPKFRKTEILIFFLLR